MGERVAQGPVPLTAPPAFEVMSPSVGSGRFPVGSPLFPARNAALSGGPRTV